MAGEWNQAPQMREEPPLLGIWAPRCSAWCGGADCPRTVIARDTERAMWRALDAYRCATCGRPNA